MISHTFRSCFVCLLVQAAAACGNDSGPKQPTSTPNLIRACLRSAACGYRPYPRIGGCTAAYKPGSPIQADLYRCVDGATSCAAVGTCFGEKGDCDSSYQASCQSGSAVACDLIDKRVYTYRCSAFGLQCKLDPGYKWAATCDGSGQPPQPLETDLNCAGDLCVKTGQTCGQTESPNDRCGGDQLESCIDGEWVRFDCTRLGLGPCRTQGDTPSTTWGHCSHPS